MSNNPYEVVFYRDQRGICAGMEFLGGLQEKVRGKILRWLDALKAQGPNLQRPHADIVRGKIRELRVVFAGNQYRLLYFFSGKRIVMTHGFVKKTGPIPQSEIERAERVLKQWDEQ